WPERFISAYATSHPWEDFAETWAHYLHVTDTVETAAAYGLRVRPPVDVEGDLATSPAFDPYGPHEVARLVDTWVPLSSLLNNLNRSMGLADPYPFILTPAVVEKLAFVQRVIRRA